MLSCVEGYREAKLLADRMHVTLIIVVPIKAKPSVFVGFGQPAVTGVCLIRPLSWHYWQPCEWPAWNWLVPSSTVASQLCFACLPSVMYDCCCYWIASHLTSSNWLAWSWRIQKVYSVTESKTYSLARPQANGVTD